MASFVASPLRRGGAARAELSARRQVCVCAEGEQRRTDIVEVRGANGGAFVDCKVQNGSKTSSHTVIVGNEILEKLCGGDKSRSDAATVTTYLFNYLMSQGVNLTNTEGLLDAAKFPINYFSLRQIFYFYPDAETKIKEMITARQETGAGAA